MPIRPKTSVLKSRRGHLALGWATILAVLLWTGCAERDIPQSSALRLPELEMIQTDLGSLEIQIAGPQGLRGLQARLTYDAAMMRITAIDAGADSSRLDRLFHASLDRAQGDLVLGLADTRQVLLPARGSLFTITFEITGDPNSVRVTLEDALGADDQSAAVRLASTSLEVKL